MLEDNNSPLRASGSPEPGAAGFSTEQAAALIARYQSVRQPRPFDGRCPYVGPVPFREADARLYFGHENQLETLLDRIERGDRLLCLSGSAQVGKTSLVQAGLIFALRNGALLDSERWLIHAFTPGDAPMQRLAEAWAALGQQAGLPTTTLEAMRARDMADPADVHTFVDALLGADARRRVVLVVDQFEQVFTQHPARNDQAASTFIRFITRLAGDLPARLILILVIRSEYLPHLARGADELDQRLRAHLIELHPMAPKELARAIVLPALETGTKIEPALVARLVADVQDEPAMLTALQTVLRDLFKAIPVRRGDEKVLTLADYLDFGPLRERPGDRPITVSDDPASPVRQPLRQALGEARAVSHFARQEARLRFMKGVTALAAGVAAVMLAFGAFGLWQSDRANRRASAAATAEAVALAEATRAAQAASAADVARATAEAQAAQAEQAREIALATRVAAEAAATRIARERLAALDQRATAIALATRVVNREQNAVAAEATARALATRSSAEVNAANRARATAEVSLRATRSRELAALALSQLPADPQLAVLLAVEAVSAQPSAQAEAALRRAFVSAFPDEQVFRHRAAVTDAAFSADGARLLTASRDGIARIWDIATGEVITSLRGHLGQVTAAAFSPDEALVVTASTDRTARVWRVDAGRTITVLVGHTGVVNDAAFSPDGRLIVTGGADRTVRVWDLATATPLTNPIQLTAVVSAVTFLGEDAIGVITANGAERFDIRTGAGVGPWAGAVLPSTTTQGDGALVWRVGDRTLPLYGHTASAMVADERAGVVVTVGADGAARLHRLDVNALLGRAKALLPRALTCEERVRYLSEALACR